MTGVDDKPPPRPRRESEGDGSKKDGGRMRNASRERKEDYRARYWAFLFENLRRAVDELFQTCETDESVRECREVIMVLENYTRDFHSLINWFKLKWSYESTPPPQRPQSLAWDIRKSSPGKAPLSPSSQGVRVPLLSPAKRQLQMSECKSTSVQTDEATLYDAESTNESVKQPEEKKEEAVVESIENKDLAQKNEKNHLENIENKEDVSIESLNSSSDIQKELHVEIDNTELMEATQPLTTTIAIQTDSDKEFDGGSLVSEELAPEMADKSVGTDPDMWDESTLQVMDVENPSISEENQSVEEQKPSASSNFNNVPLLSEVQTDTFKESRESEEQLQVQSDASSSNQEAEKRKSGEVIDEESSKPTSGDTQAGDHKEPVKVEDQMANDEPKKESKIDTSLEVDTETKIKEVAQEKTEGTSCATNSNVTIPTKTSEPSKLSEPSQSKTVTKFDSTKAAVSTPTRPKPPSKSVVSTASIRPSQSPTGSTSRTSTTTTPTKLAYAAVSRLAANRPQSLSNAGRGSPTAVKAAPTRTSSFGRGVSKKAFEIPSHRVRGTITIGRGVRGARGSLQKTGTNERVAPWNCGAGLYANRQPGKGVGISGGRISNLAATPENQQIMGSNTSICSSASSSGHSWADKVKGSTPPRGSTSSNANSETSSRSGREIDEDGWETVRGRTRSRNSPGKPSSLSKSTSNLQTVPPPRQTPFIRKCSNDTKTPTSNVVSSMPSLSMEEKKNIKNSARDKPYLGSMKATSVACIYRGKDSTENLPHSKAVPEFKRSNSVISKEGLKRTLSKSKEGSKEGLAKTLSKSKEESKENLYPNKREKKYSRQPDSRRKDQDTKSKLKEKKAESNKDKRSLDNFKAKDVAATTSSEKSAKRKLEKKQSMQEDNVVKKDSSEVSVESTPEKKESSAKELVSKREEIRKKDEKTLGIDDTSQAYSELNSDENSNLREESASCVPSIAAGSSLSSTSENPDVDSDNQREAVSPALTLSEPDDEEDIKQEAALNAALQQEESLQKELQETEKEQFEVDVHMDLGDDAQKDVQCQTLGEDYEDKLLSEFSWGERMDILDELDELTRQPGRASQIHEKLSSPSRKPTIAETLAKHREKQAKAHELRQQLMEKKAVRLRELLRKIEEVREMKEQLLADKSRRMAQKMQRAEEKRQKILRTKVRKAHDEEEKAKEIAFINELEQQNKLADLRAQDKNHSARLADLAEGRARKQEEKAAKEAAAEERRNKMEKERLARISEIQERRRRKEQHVEELQQEKEERRLEAAREKARDRSERLSALQAAQAANVEGLLKKIQQKHEDSARRYDQYMESIKQKAFELSVFRCSQNDDDAPVLAPYDPKKVCNICNVVIGSEVYLLSHLQGRKHKQAVKELNLGQDLSKEEVNTYNLKHVVDVSADDIDPQVALDKERQKALKKRCKKLRQRMAQKGAEYEKNLSNIPSGNCQQKGKLSKLQKDVQKLLDSPTKGPWPVSATTSLDRSLGEVCRILKKGQAEEQKVCWSVGWFETLGKVLSVIGEGSVVLPDKCLSLCCETFRLLCSQNVDICRYILYSNRIGTLVDLMSHRLLLLVPDNYRALMTSSPSGASSDGVAASLMGILCTVLDGLNVQQKDTSNKNHDLWARVQDVLSYIVSMGIIDKLSLYSNSVKGPIDEENLVTEFVTNSLSFLSVLCRILSQRRSRGEDQTGLLATLQLTDMCGSVSLLYGLLMHQGAPAREKEPTSELPDHSLAIAVKVIEFLEVVAILDLPVLQSVVGAEGISLQFRHILSYLLWYCLHMDNEPLLHKVITVIGYFTLSNYDNQLMVQSGGQPTVLQQLLSLPFRYFSAPHLCNLLFPTLLACTTGNPENMTILEQEMSYELLQGFLDQGSSKELHLVKCLLERTL